MKVGDNKHDDAPDALTGTVERRLKDAVNNTRKVARSVGARHGSDMVQNETVPDDDRKGRYR